MNHYLFVKSRGALPPPNIFASCYYACVPVVGPKSGARCSARLPGGTARLSDWIDCFSAHLSVLVEVVQVRGVFGRERVDVDSHLRHLHTLRHIYREGRRVVCVDSDLLY